MIRRLHTLYSKTEYLKSWFSRRFSHLGRVLLLVCALAAVFGVNVQRTMIFQIFTLSFFLVLVAYLSSLRFRTRVSATRVLPDTCIAGSELHYQVYLENQGVKAEKGLFYRESVAFYLPTPEEFRQARDSDSMTRNFFDRQMGYYSWLRLLRLGRLVKEENVPLPSLAPGEIRKTEATLLPLRRGNLYLNGYVLGRKDSFGLCRQEKATHAATKLLVLPKLYQVPELFFSGARKYHQGGITAVQQQGDANEFLALREYVHGDPIKHMDWKATARTQTPIVRQYRDEYFSRYGLILDSFTTTPFSTVFEEAVSVAASILMSQDSVNAILDLLFVGDECVTCTVGSGHTGRQRMLEILASVQTCGDKPFAQLAGLVKKHASLLSGVVVVFIDFDEKRKELVAYLRTHKIPVLVLLLTENKDDYQKIISDFPVNLIECGKVEEQLARL